MANKRMFTMKIVDSDAFLDMPLSSQCLYFHLNMRADDDGFIGNVKKIMRIVGASEDDLKLLIAKRFVLIFENGVIVIKHWRMHNTLSQNRYHETQYKDEKSFLRIKENGSYSLDKGQAIDDSKKIEAKEKYDKNYMARKRLDNGLQMADSDLDLDLDLDIDLELDKEKELDNTPPISPSQGETPNGIKQMRKRKPNTEKHRFGEYQHVMLTDEQLNKLFNDYGEFETHEAIKFLDEYIEMKGYKAKNHNLALRKWVFRAVDEEKVKQKSRSTSCRNRDVNVSRQSQLNYLLNSIREDEKNEQNGG